MKIKVEQFGHPSTYVIQVKITNLTYIRLHLDVYMCYWFTLQNKWEEGSVSNSTLCPSIILIFVASQHYSIWKKWNAWMDEMMSFFDPWWVVNYLVKQESSGPPMVLYHSKDKPLAWLPFFSNVDMKFRFRNVKKESFH